MHQEAVSELSSLPVREQTLMVSFPPADGIQVDLVKSKNIMELSQHNTSKHHIKICKPTALTHFSKLNPMIISSFLSA